MPDRLPCRRVWALGVAAIAAALVGTAACTSSTDSSNPTPLPTSASPPPRYCGFVSQDSVHVAVGETRLRATGSPAYALTGGTRTLTSATCSINDKNGQVFGVEVLQLGARPDVEQQVVDTVATGQAAYVFPASYGVGYAQTYPAASYTKAAARLLRGDYLVSLGLQRVAAGRDHLKDVVALTRQIVAALHLPVTHAKPYPTPSASR
jgi:hypothetical protein